MKSLTHLAGCVSRAEISVGERGRVDVLFENAAIFQSLEQAGASWRDVFR